MSYVSRDMETLKKKQKTRLAIKNTATENQNAFDELISGLDITEERITQLENNSIQTFQMEQQREKE